jgi:hypothetical protein
MRVYVYKLVSDSGFAPNPFHGWCTLACCKPKIRSSASPGDWVIGLSPKALGSRLVYFMRVDEVLTFDDYFHDLRFAAKKPHDLRGQPMVVRCGDNCYEPLRNGDFRQFPCFHSRDDGNGPALMRLDLGGRFVLASRHFGYFGVDAVPLDPGLEFMVPGRGHRVKFSGSERARILAYLEKQPTGLRGRPRLWPVADTSWVSRPRCV